MNVCIHINNEVKSMKFESDVEVERQPPRESVATNDGVWVSTSHIYYHDVHHLIAIPNTLDAHSSRHIRLVDCLRSHGQLSVVAFPSHQIRLFILHADNHTRATSPT